MLSQFYKYIFDIELVIIDTYSTQAFYFSIFMSLFIIYSHRSNIKRMINGTENKFKKAMIFKK